MTQRFLVYQRLPINLYIGRTLCAAILIWYYLTGKRYSFLGKILFQGSNCCQTWPASFDYFSGNYAEIRYRACNCWQPLYAPPYLLQAVEAVRRYSMIRGRKGFHSLSPPPVWVFDRNCRLLRLEYRDPVIRILMYQTMYAGTAMKIQRNTAGVLPERDGHHTCFRKLIRHYTYKFIIRYIPGTFCTKKRAPDSGNPYVFWSH